MTEPEIDSAAESPLMSWRATAMGCAVNVEVPAGATVPGRDIAEAVDRALGAFRTMERACTPAHPGSPLVRCNDQPGRWHRAPSELTRVINEARRAHHETLGLFDPCGPVIGARSRVRPGPWRPRVIGSLGLVHLGGRRVELSCLGRSLALRWAAGQVESATRDFCISAGSDVWASGRPDGGDKWRVGVGRVDPEGDPVAVIELTDTAVATAHIDEGDLRSVTVVHPDPVGARVWSEALASSGASRIGAHAEEGRLAALWVDGTGRVEASRAMEPYLIWSVALI